MFEQGNADSISIGRGWEKECRQIGEGSHLESKLLEFCTERRRELHSFGFSKQ